jgi:GMP synthase (glutamine-hydrolysing)
MIRKGKIVEPLSELYKAEVRELGQLLGIPEDRVMRHPFPGPGLGIRLLCSDVAEGTPEARAAWEEVRGLTDTCREMFGPLGLDGTVLPLKSVGVMGDARSYEHPLLVWWREPGGEPLTEGDWEPLWELATKAANRIRGVNRTVLLLHPETVDEGALEISEAYVTRERLDLLREADALVMSQLESHGIMRDIWQCPTVMLPISLGGKPLVVVRPIYSTRAMTARAAPLPVGLVTALRQRCDGLGLGGWAIDLTHKPPGTIEWE